MQEKILKCNNPNCQRYYRESKGYGDYCSQRCQMQCIPKLLEVDPQRQEWLRQIYLDQEIEKCKCGEKING